MSRNVFSKKQLYKKVPILDWLPKYDVQTGVSDLIAGVTVGLTVIPQGIAYALIAKLPPQVKMFFYLFLSGKSYKCFLSAISLRRTSKDLNFLPSFLLETKS